MRNLIYLLLFISTSAVSEEFIKISLLVAEKFEGSSIFVEAKRRFKGGYKTNMNACEVLSGRCAIYYDTSLKNFELKFNKSFSPVLEISHIRKMESEEMVLRRSYHNSANQCKDSGAKFVCKFKLSY